METNEGLRRTLLSIAETGMEQLVLSRQGAAEENLQELERYCQLKFFSW